MKVSIIIPVYYNEDTLFSLYDDLLANFIGKVDYDYEIVFVNDGSSDDSYNVMQSLAERDKNIVTISLSRNFGSHAAILCGLSNCTGDCAVIKAADLQEPTELIISLVNSWKNGNKVVLAVREGRDESMSKIAFANMYYTLVKKVALPQMPDHGFDVYLVDRTVINVLNSLEEKNSALTCQILWSGFKTDIVYYHRLARKTGKSKWTFKKKIRLVTDTLFSFTSLPISGVLAVGSLSMVIALIWMIVVLICKISGSIPVTGWTTLFIFNLFSFGITMLTLGILGEYLWRTFDASRKRPPYIIEESNLIRTNCDSSQINEE